MNPQLVEISRGDPSRLEIALTFDAGSGANYSSEIDSILSAENIRCTMFLTGDFISRYPDAVKSLVQSGHEIANHTFHHLQLSDAESLKACPGISKDFLVNDLKQANEVFHSVTGNHFAPFWRAPYGARNQEILSWTHESNLTHVYWTYDTADWRTDPADPLSRSGPLIIKELLSLAEEAPSGLNGYIILMHLGAKRLEEPLYPVLQGFIRKLKLLGYSFVTVSEMIERSRENVLAGNLMGASRSKLPLGENLETVGWVEGYYEDSWLGPYFSARLRRKDRKACVEVSVFVPEVNARSGEVQMIFSINQQVIMDCSLKAQDSHKIALPVVTDEFQLSVRTKDFFNPRSMGVSGDGRDLSVVLQSVE